MTATQGLFRFALIAGLLVISVALIATHGVRGIAIIVGIVLIATVPRTRVWRAIERPLVRITGSRRRAAVVAMLVVITAVAAFNLYSLFH